MIHILGKKQKRKRNLLSLLCHNLIPDHFSCPFLVPTHHVITGGTLSPLGDGQRMKGQITADFLSHFLFPLFSSTAPSFSFVSSAPSQAFHGPWSLWESTCSSMGSSMCQSSSAVEHLLLLWPWLLCLPSFCISAPYPSWFHRGATRVADGLS